MILTSFITDVVSVISTSVIEQSNPEPPLGRFEVPPPRQVPYDLLLYSTAVGLKTGDKVL